MYMWEFAGTNNSAAFFWFIGQAIWCCLLFHTLSFTVSLYHSLSLSLSLLSSTHLHAAGVSCSIILFPHQTQISLSLPLTPTLPFLSPLLHGQRSAACGMLLFGFWSSSVCSEVSDLFDCGCAQISVFSGCDAYATCACVILAMMIFLIPITASHAHSVDALCCL